MLDNLKWQRDAVADYVPSDLPRAEQRASIENPSVPISTSNILAFFGLNETNASGERVTIESALGVPAVWAAVNFLSGTLAGLPLHLFRRTKDGRERVKGGLSTLLRDAVNPEMSSFAWRKYSFDRVFTGGRGISYIEKADNGKIVNIWPLDPKGVVIKRTNLRTVYTYSEGGRKDTYDADEIIDIPFMLADDRLAHRSPILSSTETIGLAQAVTKYGARFFANGGVPPFAITGPFNSPGALQRSAEDLVTAVQKAAKENRLALSLPAGHEIKSIGADPEKTQLVELQRFVVEQIARIYSLPPTFLQDLTHGTFSNTEQQDLHFVKHTLMRWVTAFEQEMNLKLFGRKEARQFVKLNVDGLLRGDFKTRMEGNAQAINTAQRTPNEARALDELPPMEGGERIYIQGAMIPAEKAGEQPPEGGNDDGS